MIDKIEHEGKIDIYNFVLQMRRERSLMVQTVVCNPKNEEKIEIFLFPETICVYLSIVAGILSLWKYKNRSQSLSLDILEFKEE